MHKVYLKPGKEDSLKRFHLRVLSGTIARFDGEPDEGEVVEMYTSEREFIAEGYFQIGSITVRVLSFRQGPIDHDFWRRKLEIVYDMCRSIDITTNPTNSIYRLVHGEGDNFPRLMTDVYAKTAIIQVHFVGMHIDRMATARALPGVIGDKIENIYYKSEITLPFRADLLPENGFLKGRNSDNIAQEYGLKFRMDWLKSQKTGFFIDQHENRSLLERYVKGRSVLNIFCYTGGFSFYAMRGSAKLAHSVDSPARAIDLINKNVELNLPGNSHHETFAGDASKYLDYMGDQYDLIILDPPASAKHKDVLRNTLQGYRKLNAKASEKIKPGGILFIFSYSQVINKDNFRTTVFTVAAMPGRSIHILHQPIQPADHPVNVCHSEGECLEGLVLYTKQPAGCRSQVSIRVPDISLEVWLTREGSSRKAEDSKSIRISE